jgi:hypothetical protein
MNEALQPAPIQPVAVSKPPATIFWVAFLIAMMVGKATEWVPGTNWIPLVKISFLFAAIQAYRSRALRPAIRVRSLRIARPAIAFLALSIASLLFSVYKSETLFTSEISVIYLLTFALLIKTTLDERDIETLLLGLTAAAISLTVGTLYYYQGGRAGINDSFDPNDIAYDLDTLLPVVLALRVSGSKWRSLLLSALALAMIASVLLTGSRGGAIGFGVVLVLMTAFPMSLGKDGRPKPFSLPKFVVKGILIAILAGCAYGYLPADTRERLETLLDLGNDYNADETSNAARTTIWRRDVLVAFERPIGYGMGTADYVDGTHGGVYKTAHNSVVEAFVELGLLGVSLYFYCYYACCKYLLRIARTPRTTDPVRAAKSALYARALAIGLAGNFAAGFFLSQAYSASLWMIVAICAAFLRVTLPELETGPPAETHGATAQSTALSARALPPAS